jgi:carboxylesterase
VPVLPGAEPWSAAGGPVGVLLVHGFTGSPQSLRPWGEHLAAAGLTVSLPRLPGHGTSWQEMAMTRWEDWYAEAERALLDLRGPVRPGLRHGAVDGRGALAAPGAGAPAGGRRPRLVNPSVHGEHPLLKVVPLLKHVLPSYKGVSNDIKKPGASSWRTTACPSAPSRHWCSSGRSYAVSSGRSPSRS